MEVHQAYFGGNLEDNLEAARGARFVRLPTINLNGNLLIEHTGEVVSFGSTELLVFFEYTEEVLSFEHTEHGHRINE